jgi:hypothetical protein
VTDASEADKAKDGSGELHLEDAAGKDVSLKDRLFE